MEQIGRNITDCEDGILKTKRYLIQVRDPLYTAQFVGILSESGVESMKLPPRSPQAIFNSSTHTLSFTFSQKAPTYYQACPINPRGWPSGPLRLC
jgi:hypothetical protein